MSSPTAKSSREDTLRSCHGLFHVRFATDPSGCIIELICTAGRELSCTTTVGIRRTRCSISLHSARAGTSSLVSFVAARHGVAAPKASSQSTGGGGGDMREPSIPARRRFRFFGIDAQICTALVDGPASTAATMNAAPCRLRCGCVRRRLRRRRRRKH